MSNIVQFQYKEIVFFFISIPRKLSSIADIYFLLTLHNRTHIYMYSNELALFLSEFSSPILKLTHSLFVYGYKFALWQINQAIW